MNQKPTFSLLLAEMRHLLQNGPNGALATGVAPLATPLFAPDTPPFTTHLFNAPKAKTGGGVAKTEADQ